ncbi:hypothetical protein JJE72_14165 [Sinomonas sp. JC656]|uniref:Uncharacterized protein n=1 Tax=Sinomonas cellulolyticus TaxID=2801916 RepID=A0ABS1K4Q8_9MICC|nr:hypothetical protein [Sinomonas cellulolyticus]
MSPAVYRRRRIAVLVLMVLVLGVLGVGVWAAAVDVGSVADDARRTGTVPVADPAATPEARSATPSPDASANAAPTSTGTATAMPDASASPAASATTGTATASAGPCDPHLITVSASTDKPSYAPNEKPVFTLKVTNGNPMPCEVNVGTKQMEFLVVSGTDRVFSSKDCQADAQDLPKTIAAGASETANFPWARVRSTEGCKAATVQPKPGIYVMTASLGATTSSKAVFELK